MSRLWLGCPALVAVAMAAGPSLPVFPTEYSAVIQMSMPYIGMEMSLRVLTSATVQKIEYYDGLEVDVSNAHGTYKYSFNNSRRVCAFTPPSSGPKLADSKWSASPFFPNLSQYSYAGESLLGGITCQKYTLYTPHGSVGTMDDHISFYWDPVLGKPVRWHMHSRHVTFGSHTDEYIMDFLSFQPVAPDAGDLSLPEACVHQPHPANVSIQIYNFLEAAHAMRRPPVGLDDTPPHFDAFRAQYGKVYSAGQEAARQAAFDRNAGMVRELNREHAGRATFRGNQFLDMTVAEVLRFRGGKTKGTTREERRRPEHQEFLSVFEASDAVDPPKDFDWRVARPGVVSPVKDQAMCGSCWTYGVTEPVESIQAIKTGRLVPLQEQFVMDCTWTNNTGASGQNSACDGGDSDIGALEIVRKYGGVIPSAAAYGSYLSVNGYCKDIRLMEVGAKLTGWADIPLRDERALLQALYTVGPLNVNIMVPPPMLYYDSGVLNVEACRSDPKQIDHAVVSTGFGVDEHGTAYYTIRNSWSTYWGDQGYIRIARGDLDCCVSCQAGYPLLTVDQANLVV